MSLNFIPSHFIFVSNMVLIILIVVFSYSYSFLYWNCFSISSWGFCIVIFLDLYFMLWFGLTIHVTSSYRLGRVGFSHLKKIKISFIIINFVENWYSFIFLFFCEFDFSFQLCPSIQYLMIFKVWSSMFRFLILILHLFLSNFNLYSISFLDP